jgi:hypothetical protein
MLSADEYRHMRHIALSILNSDQQIPSDTLLPSKNSESKFTFDALISLRNQLVVRKLKKESYLIDRMMHDIKNRVLTNGESLQSIAHSLSFSSYKLAKSFLEIYFNRQMTISLFMENPSIISDIYLREDILNCISEDPVCSLESTLIAECYGREYENVLVGHLKRFYLCFETEQELRSKGRSKTPDALFLIPMATITLESSSSSSSNSNNSNELSVVNWIDSKAMFADDETFLENLAQFKAYNNRYGKGLVIYWFGFSESVLEIIRREDLGLAVSSRFPDHWVFPTGEVATGSPPSFCRPISKK